MHELRVTSDDFLAGFNQASLDYELWYKLRLTDFTDIGLAMVLIKTAYLPGQSDLYKAGYLAGFFCALYGVPYRWKASEDENILQYGLTHLGRRKVS